MNVYILTFCRNPELFYGTELIFKTLRVGFPNARVTVVDNCSLPDARIEIERLARESDCRFVPVDGAAMAHHEYLEETLEDVANDSEVGGPLVFLDPDICLWECCEGFSFAGLIAGKRLGKFDDRLMSTVTMPRLHSSFLWIPDPGALWREVSDLKERRFDFEPFQPVSVPLPHGWIRFDTGASLLGALGDRAIGFGEEQLRRYDHIYAGSHLDWLLPRYDERCRQLLTQTHRCAKEGNLEALKGIRRYQDAVFARSFTHLTA